MSQCKIILMKLVIIKFLIFPFNNMTDNNENNDIYSVIYNIYPTHLLLTTDYDNGVQLLISHEKNICKSDWQKVMNC